MVVIFLDFMILLDSLMILRKWVPVCENWSFDSGPYGLIHLLGPSSGPPPRSQGHGIFCDFIILLDSSNASEENEVLFVKSEARVPNLWLNTSFESKWPKQIL